MFITAKLIDRLAQLIRLQLTEDEQSALTNYVDQASKELADLLQVDTSGIEPTINVLQDNSMPLRDDVVKPSLPVDTVLANAPDSFGQFFKVPLMIGADSDE